MNHQLGQVVSPLWPPGSSDSAMEPWPVRALGVDSADGRRAPRIIAAIDGWRTTPSWRRNRTSSAPPLVDNDRSGDERFRYSPRAIYSPEF